MCQDCERLYEELKKQQAIMFGLRKRISSLNGELRHERREKQKLIKQNKEKQHYRNGQKRGRTRNG